jgi:hypothetical protein
MAQERREIERLAFTFAKGGATFVEDLLRLHDMRDRYLVGLTTVVTAHFQYNRTQDVRWRSLAGRQSPLFRPRSGSFHRVEHRPGFVSRQMAVE